MMVRPIKLVVAIVWALSSLLLASDPQQAETLRGLKGIGVLIGLDVVIQDAGVSTQTLRPEIEARLKRANIPTISRTALMQKAIREPILTVNFSGTSKLGDAFAYKMELLMLQRVRLERDQSIESIVPTWSVTREGSIRAGEADKLRGPVADALDEFIKAYRSVNP